MIFLINLLIDISNFYTILCNYLKLLIILEMTLYLALTIDYNIIDYNLFEALIVGASIINIIFVIKLLYKQILLHIIH